MGVASKPIILSYGGGTQSAAICVLIAKGRLPRPERIVIADTGREATQTWEYLDNAIQPLMAKVGLTIEIAPHSLAVVDLYRKDSLLLPVYTKNGKLPGYCSGEWKREVVSRWMRQQGYGTANPVKLWIGISLDEIGRAKPSSRNWIEHEWPLLLGMDRALTRGDCKRLVLDAGLPEPPKSSCWMCPYRSDRQWLQLKESYPGDFAAAAALEHEIHQRDTQGGVWLTRHRRPLDEVDFTPSDNPQSSLFGEVEQCDSGFCWV